MNPSKHRMMFGLTTAVLVSSSLTVLQFPARAGFWSNTVDSVRHELKNCVHGGCDPTQTNPREVLDTTSGVRAFGAATDRWMNRQVRIGTAQANELKNRLQQRINENSQCMELPSMEGVCTELNQYYGLNMPIERLSWEQIASRQTNANVQFLSDCVNKKNLPFESTKELICLPYSNYTE
ncbi:MAG: hypothetical protein HCA25_22595 [Dolichospermum sp. DET50]|nr:hypothetical protein [Dolichospermum sp. DET66]MBS3034960.1 hypothetical protein [Dolichospermum sp. DET67]MBS3040160.1 hypothetical protein [Dolichospermum sp. DET50]QSX67335.1 MAG: hypothetical protein EZY12_21870 [Dolichospermum sp. DET69]